MDNDATLRRYASMALAQAEAGADLLGTSGMMDGQVGVVRRALDGAGRGDVGVLAYAPKYASAFYGPFREAVDSSLTGDRLTYQQDPSRGVREALAEVALDVAEGADMVMVKPALPYLDILSAVAASLPGAGGGLPGVRRVRDGRGGRRARLARPGAGDPGDAAVDPAGRRVDRS